MQEKTTKGRLELTVLVIATFAMIVAGVCSVQWWQTHEELKELREENREMRRDLDYLKGFMDADGMFDAGC